MKTDIRRVAAALLLGALLLADSALALQEGQGYKPQDFGGWTVHVDGIHIGSNIAPIVIEGQTFVPLRRLCELLRAEIVWDNEQKAATITKGDRSLTLTMGAYTALRDGEQIAIDVPARLWADIAQAPVRLVAEAMGARVKWQGADSAILVLTEPEDYEGYLATPESFFAKDPEARGVPLGTSRYLDATAVERFGIKLLYHGQSDADSWLFRTDWGDFVLSDFVINGASGPNWDKIKAGERYRVCFSYRGQSEALNLPWGTFNGLGELPISN